MRVASEILPSLVGAYNYASAGTKYQFLSSKALPDPIQVGNMGDLNGNMASPDTPFDLSSVVGDLYSGALGFLQTMYASPTNGDVGIAKNDGDKSTGPGWSKMPAPDGGMTWNLTHLQAAHHLDGVTIIPPAVDWFNEVRLVVLNDQVASKLANLGTPGTCDLRLNHDFGRNYVFVPAFATTS